MLMTALQSAGFLLALCCSFTTPTLAQESALPPVLTICEALRNFDMYRGKDVVIVGRYEFTFEGAVAVLTGSGGTFCAGADLKAVATGNGNPAFRTGLIGRRTALRTAKTIRAGNHRDSKSQSLAQAH